ncbi:MAG: glycosyltransferase [Bacteroidales bacterium]|jgi:cellulose synthase/poly-beta-1,6-N-acetylglucosamine synthase-like glycosyltransferase|nr:glycosyltransferase [Bacteroidales bacterium]MCK9499018.1 glycosyltransferase [Bacteroidales bacterium]NLB87235.1 glycosyltransferase [Bacteroidales bacterium]
MSFIWINIGLIAIYLIVILIFTIVFIKRKTFAEKCNDFSKKISLIVAFRNEKKNLKNLINSLLNQNNAPSFEIILVNDHSEDNFMEFLDLFRDERIKIFNLPDGLIGKKAALRYGISQSQGEILFFTDADCVLPKNWISTMLAYQQKNNVQMLCGPVKFKNSKKFLDKIFALEFMSMTGSGAAGFFINKPFMCNAANYCVCRSVLSEVEEKGFNERYSSGDDVFLLHYVSSKYKVDFLKSYEVCVETPAPFSLQSFFNQRVRWASKLSGYRNVFAIFMGIITYISAFSLILLAVLSLFFTKYYTLLLALFVVKLIVELLFLIPISKFYKQEKYLIYLPILQLFHPLYIVFIPLFSVFYKPKWKNRKIR